MTRPIQIKTIRDFQSVQRKLDAAMRPLRNLGIEIDSLGRINFKWEENESIAEEVKKTSCDIFGCTLSFDEKLTLQLAEAQECYNDYLDQSEIDRVNEFFKDSLKRPIEHRDISKIGNKYI